MPCPLCEEVSTVPSADQIAPVPPAVSAPPTPPAVDDIRVPLDEEAEVAPPPEPFTPETGADEPVPLPRKPLRRQFFEGRAATPFSDVPESEDPPEIPLDEESTEDIGDDSPDQLAVSDESPQPWTRPVFRRAGSSAAPDRQESTASSTETDGDLEENADDEGGFETRPAVVDNGDLDLTPMVDVTFLLLIFFMITASFSLQKTISVPPPNPDEKGAAQALTLEDLQDNTVFVRIDEKNAIWVDDAPIPSLDQVADSLIRARLASLRSEVAIDPHPDSLHETLVAVIDAATEAEMQKVRIVSHTLGD